MGDVGVLTLRPIQQSGYWRVEIVAAMSAWDPEQTFSASFDHFVDDQLLAPDQ
jgi:hypothetical protein